VAICFLTISFGSSRPDPHPRGAAQQPDSLQEQDEEILGSDDEEQEDPNDYCKGRSPVLTVLVCSESILYAFTVFPTGFFPLGGNFVHFKAKLISLAFTSSSNPCSQCKLNKGKSW